MLTKEQLLKPLAAQRTNEIVVTTMSTVRPWGRLSDHPLDFASADSAMGHAADLALGLAMTQPGRRVICLNGDGSMLMTLGTLVTVIESGVRNLTLFVVANATYEITGNQPVPAAARTDWPAIARASGFQTVHDFHDPAQYEATLPEILSATGNVFASVHTHPGTEGPISRRPDEPAPYLQVSMAESARMVRQALGAPAPREAPAP